MISLIGTLYFKYIRDKQGKPASDYVGKVVGLLVKKDNGEIVTITEEKPLGKSGPLKWNECTNALVGESLLYRGERVKVLRVYEDYGEITIQHETGDTNTVDWSSLVWG